MAGPLGKILAQALVMGASVFSRAFVQAYAQAVKNAKSGAKVTATQASTLTTKPKMTLPEALSILNLQQKDLTTPDGPTKIVTQYDRFFKMNDPSTGGSFYLQSKIFRAKEAVDDHLKEEGEGPKK